MLRSTIFFVTVGLVIASLPARADDKFEPLFDGKSFEGWVGDERLWSVQEGAIVGSSDEHKIEHNTFLATKTQYANFVLKLKFKLRNHNSGVQFRSKLHDDFVVKGYQADIADDKHLGILYSEGTGRGILANVKPEEVKKHLKADDWNEYVITVDGPRIRQELNGYTTIEFTEKEPDQPEKGVIALQLHAGPAMQVSFKDILIKELP